MRRETLLHLKSAIRFATKATQQEGAKNRLQYIERAVNSLLFAVRVG